MRDRMSETRDVIIVGGGHNGLVAAFYLAKAGFKPLVLERRAQVGGAAITEEFHPGFRCSTLAHNAGPLRADIVRDMQLEQARPQAHDSRCEHSLATARRPGASPLLRRKKSGAGNRAVVAERRGLLRGLRRGPGKDRQGHRRSARCSRRRTSTAPTAAISGEC